MLYFQFLDIKMPVPRTCCIKIVATLLWPCVTCKKWGLFEFKRANWPYGEHWWGLLFQTFSPSARCSLGIETSDPKILDFQTARWHWTNLRDFLKSHHFRISHPDGTIWECTHTPKAPYVIIFHHHYYYPLQWTIPLWCVSVAGKH